MATSKTPSTDPKLQNSLARLAALAPAPVPTEAPEASTSPVESFPAAQGQSEATPAEAVAAAVQTLRTAPKKRPVVLVERVDAPGPLKVGRKTNKTGDLQTDYVKISPKIPVVLKDKADLALLTLRKDASHGVRSLEDLITKAMEQYLHGHNF
jgi:hypothetical protein